MKTKTHNHDHVHTHESNLTKTATLHKEYSSELFKRFRKLKGLIREAIVTQDIFNLKGHKPYNMRMALHQEVEILPDPNDFDFKTDDEKISAFTSWLQKREDEGILEVIDRGDAGQVIDRKPWQNAYVRRGYGKGIQHADQALRKEGVSVPSKTRLTQIFNKPIHASALKSLYTRNFMELKGITNAMDQQISRQLANGFSQGWNPYKVANKINDRVDKIGITRARTLARTETIRAHYKSTMNRYREHDVKYVEFMFGGGPCPGNVCPPYDGKVFKVGEEISIPLHPNCGCAYKPRIKNPNKISAVRI